MLTAALLFLIFAVAQVRAGQATEEIRATTDRVLALLNNPGLQGDAKKSERHHLIRKEIDARFNWPEAARGSLGRHWLKLTPGQQKEFVGLFSEFLERTYLDKFDTYYVNVEHIDYQGEKIIQDHASVRVVMHTKAKLEHPVEYRLEKSSGDWRIYDTLIEGVSMVKNYRDQFDAIIARSSYEELIKELRNKLDANQ
jgi:phospholipid transport system substrate-binding protein